MSAHPLPPELARRLSADQLARLEGYFALLLETNRKFNLTAIRNEEEAWERHIVESLGFLRFVDARCPPSTESVVAGLQGEPRKPTAPEELLDVGSGGGLPGMVLAIARPDLRVTLLESIEKKARFLEDAARENGLENVRVVCERAENAAAPGSSERERYSLVTARAVAALPTLLELTVPFAKPHGTILAIKGERASEELAAAAKAMEELGAELQAQQRTATATVITLTKTRSTPRKFPRRVGEPKRRPL